MSTIDLQKRSKDRISYKKSTNANLKKSAILENILGYFFFVYIGSLYNKIAFWEIETSWVWGVKDPFEKKSIFSQKLRHLRKIRHFVFLKMNRKLRVATKIGSNFFWFLTSYRAAKIVQNDYLSSAWNFRSIEYHHALYLNFGTLAGLWP
jgi:hypothetical protein